MHRFALLSALVVLVSGGALADNIYRWRDSAGVDHYTNDLNTIPTSATVVPTSGGDISEISTGAKDAKAKAAPAKPSPQETADRKTQAEVRRAEAEARLVEAQLKREEMASEEQWRALFRSIRARVSALEGELERERASGNYSGLPVQGRYVSVGQRLHAYAPDPILEGRLRVNELERELKVARDEYSDLERRASFAAVPRHWRQ